MHLTPTHAISSCYDGEHEGCGIIGNAVSCSPFYCKTPSDITVYVLSSYSIPSDNTFCGKSVTYSKSILSETIGTTITWTLYSTGMTRINGTGELSQYPQTFNQQLSSIKEIIIESGITSITKNSFLNLINLEKITLPNSITSIEQSTFDSCSSLKEIVIDETNEYYSIDENGNLYNKLTSEIVFTITSSS